MLLNKVSSISGRLRVPGDKSISHRAIMLGSLANGKTVIHNFLSGADCISTINCFTELGISINHQKAEQIVEVYGKGLRGLTAPKQSLDTGNSGTTMRLISGILCGQPFDSELTGDNSIQKRPMNRIIDPLCEMEADIQSKAGNGCAPLLIRGRRQPLHAIEYLSPVSSAQVKSSLLLAGLYADGTTSVTEPYLSRNHTELMLKQFGASITWKNTTASICAGSQMTATELNVPGDISSAAYFITAAAILPSSELLLEQVGVNPTRDGILRIGKQMGMNFCLEQMEHQDGEATADIRICSSTMHGCVIEGDIIPALIDELPIIAVMACFAEGTTIIRDAWELKVKESNRIDLMAECLSAMGADITATEDGMIIQGGKALHGAVIDSKGDHRIAMSLAIAALAADGETTILGEDCVEISYPGFFSALNSLCK